MGNIANRKCGCAWRQNIFNKSVVFVMWTVLIHINATDYATGIVATVWQWAAHVLAYTAQYASWNRMADSGLWLLACAAARAQKQYCRRGEERSAAAPQKSSSRCLQKLGFRFIFHRLFCVEAKNVPQMLLRIIQVFTYADMLHLIMLNNINIKKVVYYVIFGVYYFIKLRLCLKICV